MSLIFSLGTSGITIFGRNSADEGPFQVRFYNPLAESRFSHMLAGVAVDPLYLNFFSVSCGEYTPVLLPGKEWVWQGVLSKPTQSPIDSKKVIIPVESDSLRACFLFYEENYTKVRAAMRSPFGDSCKSELTYFPHFELATFNDEVSALSAISQISAEYEGRRILIHTMECQVRKCES